MKIRQLSIFIVSLMLILLPSMAQSTSVTRTFTGTVPSGPFAGMVGTGSFTYEDALIVTGDEVLKTADGLTLNLLFDGLSFNQTNDVYFNIFPELVFSNSSPLTLDFVLNDGVNGVSFNTPNLFAVITDDLFPFVVGYDSFVVGYDYLIEINAYPATIPEPATMLLLGTGLVGVAGAARRKKKNQT